jgi:hypothetical protein
MRLAYSQSEKASGRARRLAPALLAKAGASCALEAENGAVLERLGVGGRCQGGRWS